MLHGGGAGEEGGFRGLAVTSAQLCSSATPGLGGRTPILSHTAVTVAMIKGSVCSQSLSVFSITELL